MRVPTILAIYLLLLVLTQNPAQVSNQTPAPAMPSTEGETLTGKHLVLSQVSAGHPTILVMGFSKDAGDPATDWARALRKDPALSQVHVYEAAMLAAAPAFIRGVIKSSIRKGILPVDQESFVILTRDEQSWRTWFGVTNDKESYVVLLDPQGKIQWHGHGAAKDLLPQLRAAAH